MQDISNYEKVRENALNFYKKIGRISCPAFNNEPVYFTAEGFNHLIYKNDRRERDKSVQIMKFKLLPKAKDVVGRSATYQEYDECLIEVKREKKGRILKETCLAHYWGLVAIMQDFRIKVIVRQCGNGQKHFWSVIPAWSKSHYRDIKIVSTAKGDLPDD